MRRAAESLLHTGFTTTHHESPHQKKTAAPELVMNRSAFPQRGSAAADVLSALRDAKAGDVDWRAGKTNLYVQFGGDDVLEISRRAADLYFSENAHGLAAFPSVQRLQSDVLGFLLNLLSGGPNADGCLTGSGSESIFLALKTARDWARARNPALSTPKIIVPRSAHPAFDKAGAILGIEVVRTPLRHDFRADTEAIRSSICSRTIALGGSAPQFGHGVVDNIDEMASLAVAHNLWLHVDACIGAMVAPFVRLSGRSVPHFDFRIDGVRSISADLHKYGFAAKGISAVLFRHQCWRPHYTFEFDDWPIGAYTSSGLAGTRSAATIASAWAVIHYLGVEGFVRVAHQLMTGTDRLTNGLKSIAGVELVSQPDLPIVAWRCEDLSTQGLAAQLRKRGWFVRTMARPEAIHLGMISMHQLPVIDDYLDHVRACIERVRSGNHD